MVYMVSDQILKSFQVISPVGTFSLSLLSWIFCDHLILVFCFDSVQSNADRANSKRLVDKFRSGKMGEGGFAPILICVIIVLIILFINSVLAGE